MSTSKDEIGHWFDLAVESESTHLIVACDTFDCTDFPVFVIPPVQVEDKIAEYNNSDKMVRVLEVYNLKLDKQSQLNSERAWNL
jgi:hypothetical protein